MDNSNKIILDLCGGSGSWSSPYKEAGYDVRVITLPDADVLTWTYRDGMLVFFSSDLETVIEVPVANVYGILAAPPCTEFSIAKGARPRDLEGAMEIVNACKKIIHHCRLYGNLKFWAMENPRGLMRQFEGIPHFQFEHWQFGGDICKPTDIWGYFKSPTPTVKERPASIASVKMPGGSYRSAKCGYEYRDVPEWCADYIKSLPHREQRAALRAITPEGFAHAFFKANK